MPYIGFDCCNRSIEQAAFSANPIEKFFLQSVHSRGIDVDAENVVTNDGEPPSRIGEMFARGIVDVWRQFSPTQFVEDFQQEGAVAACGVEHATGWRVSRGIGRVWRTAVSVKTLANHPPGNGLRSIHASKFAAGHREFKLESLSWAVVSRWASR